MTEYDDFAKQSGKRGIQEYLEAAHNAGASDVFIVAGAPVSQKINGKMEPVLDTEKIFPEDTAFLIRDIYKLASRSDERLSAGDDDFSFALKGIARFRVSTYRQRGSLAAVIRIVAFELPDWHKIGIPESVIDLSKALHGLVLVTGTAGSGKSTTEACIINEINRTRSSHIITIEDPIEFLHRNNKSIVSQREISIDTKDCLTALRACLRQAPDVIQLGELRDTETIRTAITAAETGHLIFATMHTHGAANSIDRIIDVFPADQQEQIRVQLSIVLKTVVSQQLLPTVSGGRVAAFEIMNMNSSIRSMIRDGKTHQIPNAISSGAADGMLSMDQSIFGLYRKGLISADTAITKADSPEQMQRRIS